MFDLSVCVELFWPQLPVEQRIRNVAKLGYKAIEFWNWSDKDIPSIRKAIGETGVAVACFCMEPAFCLTEDTRGKEIVEGFCESAKVAREVAADCLIATTGDAISGEPYETTRRRVVGVLKELSKAAEDAGITIVLEPLNTIVDHPNYWLSRMADAVDIINEVDSSAVRILMDLYHQQITEGNLIATIRRYVGLVGHFHCAGVPGRGDLVGGELDYRAIFTAIAEAGYDRYVGLELSPAGGDEEALAGAVELISSSAR